ncbi:hypothetical protein B0H34DRAFT_739010 [Crassisporium funariophilum]|nr:hypothetical protein B0H34DRAFT_739010 [Crassisporium funariophilum]
MSSRREPECTQQRLIVKDDGTVILLLGVGAVGKTTFVNSAAAKEALEVNHTLSSHGLNVNHYTVPHPDSKRAFVFIDPPGFDHSTVSDKVVMKTIIDWMKNACSPDAHFGGIVYLHNINADRFPAKNASKFQIERLSHPGLTSRTVIATAKWGLVNQEHKSSAELHATELKKYWEILSGRGARVGRFDNTKASAWDIVDTLLSGQEPLKLNVVQEELDRIHSSLLEKRKQKRSKGGFFSFLFRLFG